MLDHEDASPHFKASASIRHVRFGTSHDQEDRRRCGFTALEVPAGEPPLISVLADKVSRRS